MAVSPKHVLQQGPVLAALGRTAVQAVRQRFGRAGAPTSVPGPELVETVPARPADLIRDYVRSVGGNPKAYRGHVPAHLFPQWGFPLLSRTLDGIPYPLSKVLNGGCRMEINAPIAADAPLTLTAQLVDIDDNGSRAVLKQELTTSTPDAPNALVSTMFAIVPLGSKGSKGGASNGSKPPKPPSKPKKARPRVPSGARELAFWKLTERDALDFAILTGDFNPVHWIPAYARAAGFPNTIMHGFGTLARAIEGLNDSLWAGDVSKLKTVDVQFTRPLVLPARVGLYVDGDKVFVGDAPGGPAYMVGTFEAA